eukprot:40380_1
MARVCLLNEPEVRNVLEEVNDDRKQWVIFHHKSRSDIAILKSGVGIPSLVDEFPRDEVRYAIVTFDCPMDGNLIKKSLLVTMVGEFTSPMRKASSSATRVQLLDMLMKYTPVASHFQANESEEICEEEFMAKLRVDPTSRAKWKRQPGQKFMPGRSGCSGHAAVNFGSAQSVDSGRKLYRQVSDRTAKVIHENAYSSYSEVRSPPAPPTFVAKFESMSVSDQENSLEPMSTDYSDTVSTTSSQMSEIAFCGDCGTRREDLTAMFCCECGCHYD